MKVERFKNGSITTYNKSGSEFIATLNEVSQNYIHRGLATPYDYGYKPKTSGVTLDKEAEFEEDEYCLKLNTFTVFNRNLKHYLLYNPKADETVFKVYKSIQKWVDTPTDPEVCVDNKVCLVTYLQDEWNAWFESILNKEYKYMNLTSIVWSSWEEV